MIEHKIFKWQCFQPIIPVTIGFVIGWMIGGFSVELILNMCLAYISMLLLVYSIIIATETLLSWKYMGLSVKSTEFRLGVLPGINVLYAGYLFVTTKPWRRS